MSFTFRQRAGKLNWKIVSSVNVDNVVETSDIVELQSVIDVITFSEFSAVDVKANTVDAVSKLVNIMQLAIEYLLYCQESQCRLLQVMQERNASLKKKCSTFKKELTAMTEDNKIYQRQLQMLRKSLMNSQYAMGSPSNPRIVLGGPREHDVENVNENAKTAVSALMDTVLQHERDNREFLRSLLDEQRSTFFSELNRMSSHKDHPMDRQSAVGADRENNNKRMEDSMNEMTSRLCSQVEGLLQTTITSMGDSSVKLLTAMTAASHHQLHPQPIIQTPLMTTSAVPTTPTTTSNQSSELITEITRLKDMLSTTQTKLDEQSHQHQQLLQSITDREQQWLQEKQELLNSIQGYAAKLKVMESGNTEGAQLTKKMKKHSLTSICRFIANGNLREQRNYFMRWSKLVVDMRFSEEQTEHSRLLGSTVKLHQLQEKELKTELMKERESSRSLQDQLAREQEQARLMPPPRLRVDMGVNTDANPRYSTSSSSIDQVFLKLSDMALMKRAESKISSQINEEDDINIMNNLAVEITSRMRKTKPAR